MVDSAREIVGEFLALTGWHKLLQPGLRIFSIFSFLQFLRIFEALTGESEFSLKRILSLLGKGAKKALLIDHVY